jgi:signal transduction histidine kinase
VTGPNEREFAGDPRAPAEARHFAKRVLLTMLDGSTPQPLLDDVELVVSELVTNAVRAGSPTVAVALSRKGSTIVLSVSDRGVGWPAERDAASDDPGGRGLPLVRALSSAWGVRQADTGKVVWAELRLPPH